MFPASGEGEYTFEEVFLKDWFSIVYEGFSVDEM